MMRARPPFRADHVGSLLLQDARAKHARGENMAGAAALLHARQSLFLSQTSA